MRWLTFGRLRNRQARHERRRGYPSPAMAPLDKVERKSRENRHPSGCVSRPKANAGIACRKRCACENRSSLSRGPRSSELERSTRHGHRVTLTAAPSFPRGSPRGKRSPGLDPGPVASRSAPIEKSLSRTRTRPRDITGNVQLYLSEERQPPRMRAPLAGDGGVVKGTSCVAITYATCQTDL